MSSVSVIGQTNGVQVVVRPKDEDAGRKIVSLTEGDEVEAKIKCNLGCDHKLKGRVQMNPDGPSYHFVNADIDLPLRTLLKMGATFEVTKKSK